MKKLLLSSISLCFYSISSIVYAQVFWTEDFGIGCDQGQLAAGFSSANGIWSVTNTGPNQTDANIWFVSAQENGHLPGECGTGCGNNRTLHLGSKELFGGLIPADLGAAYNASTGNYVTNKRIESPTINCTGKTVITLTFTYIENGQGSIDDCILWYFDGSSWSMLSNTAKTVLCGAQGEWTGFSMLLPSSADNNANVKIGFNWTNNADGIGTDPSFAVDDIRLSTPIPTPIELLDFTASQQGAQIDLNWTTLSEKNNDFFTVEKSINGYDWFNLLKIRGAKNSISQMNYAGIDPNPSSGMNYYRLNQTDYDGKTTTISSILSVDFNSISDFSLFPNPTFSDRFHLTYTSISVIENSQVKVINQLGEAVFQSSFKTEKGNNFRQFDLPQNLQNGIYFIHLQFGEKQYIEKLIVNQ